MLPELNSFNDAVSLLIIVHITLLATVANCLKKKIKKELRMVNSLIRCNPE